MDIIQIVEFQDGLVLTEASLKTWEKLFPTKVVENLIPFLDGE
jgi:hypothetical protein